MLNEEDKGTWATNLPRVRVTSRASKRGRTTSEGRGTTLRGGDRARRQPAVDSEIKIECGQGVTQSLTVFLVESESKFYTPFKLIQVLVGQIITYRRTSPPLLHPPSFPCNVPWLLAHR